MNALLSAIAVRCGRNRLYWASVMLSFSAAQSISFVAFMRRKPPEGSGTRMVTVTATS